MMSVSLRHRLLLAASALALGSVAIGAATTKGKSSAKSQSATLPTDKNAKDFVPKQADDVRPIPPPGGDLKPADRQRLEAGVKQLEAAIDELKPSLSRQPALLSYLPDVQIYYNAVRYPLKYAESIDPKQADKGIQDGLERAAQLKSGQHPWTDKSGPRGYVSKIDGSVQPYILSVPSKYKPGQPEPMPLALSCHGRNEKLTELSFISTKVGEGNAGNSTVGDPSTKFIIYLYGRYCCANKLAGEIDLSEAWDRVADQYPIDPLHVSLTGFSMGGGAVWHLAAHYGEKFCVATPGAGFSESQRFLKLADIGETPPWYESALYRLYNATEQAENFYNCKTISYAGENDKQKQAGDVMEEAMAKIGLKLERFVGPGVEHKYEPETKKKLDARVEELSQKGLIKTPKRVQFATYSLRYDSNLWVTVTAMEQHWKKALVDAEITSPTAIKVKTQNVAGLLLKFPASKGPLAKDKVIHVEVDDQPVTFSEDAALAAMFALKKADGKWTQDVPVGGLRKRHGLQGPIDDAFLDSFVIVKPSGKGVHDSTADWAAGECNRMIGEWRKQFRGEARVKQAAQISDDDIASSNLVLFGDPQSNPLIARVLPKLPIEWSDEKLLVNGKAFDPARYLPVLIFPNPLNPRRYVVLNSGFTFREADYLNNARQTPKLPDYAVIDTQTPPTKIGWGTLPKAGFFGEHWEWLADDGQSVMK